MNHLERTEWHAWLCREYLGGLVTVETRPGVGLVQEVEIKGSEILFTVYLNGDEVRVPATQCYRYRRSQRHRAQG